MYKVLIADDETIIREGILSLIEWKRMNIHLVAEAEDGETAYEKAIKTRPDIILLDICMPFLNGLELIEKIKNDLKETLIIIISGYDEFSYAQKALEMQVFDYLLKPVQKEKINDVLQKAVCKLDNLERANKYLMFAQTQIQNNMPFFTDNFFNNIIDNLLTDYEIKDYSEHFGIRIHEESLAVLIKSSRSDLFNDELDELSKHMFNFAMQNIVEEIWADTTIHVIFRDRKGNFVMIIEDTCNYEKNVRETSDAVSQYLKKEINIVCERLHNGLTELSQCYTRLTEVLAQKLGASPIVKRITEYMEKNFDDPDLSISLLSENMNISQAYISRLLKSETGMTFIEHLTQLRIKKALKLLENPNIKIVEVAEKVGYNTQHYFCTAFKKSLGVSPSVYRMENR